MVQGTSAFPKWAPKGRAGALGARPVTRLLLVSGILSSCLYAAMLIFVPMGWAGYSSAAHTVSELSAIDAPTRSLWLSLGVFWSTLYAAFGCGVWLSARGHRGVWLSERSRRALQVAGGAILVAAVFGMFWPPMHRREVLAAGGETLTDTLHLVWTAVNGILTLLAMAFSAAAFGKRFRRFSIASIVVVVLAGALTALDAPRLEANLPTPWVGVWERVNIGAWLLWVVVLAVTLLWSVPSLAPASPTERG